MFDGMGSKKLNDMRKTWYGHKNCNSHSCVNGGAINIVDRPANKEGKEVLKNEYSTEDKVRLLEVSLVLA